jgi:hypothetical protein
MKTTLELPDAILRRAKAKAAEQKIPLRQFVSDAVADKLQAKGGKEARRKLAGKLAHLRKESVRITRLLEREFERIEAEQ